MPRLLALLPALSALSTCKFPEAAAVKPLPDTAPRMYVDDAVQHAQAAKGGGAAAGVAALSLEPSPAPATLWVLVELERPVFCPENSICVASKLEVRAKTSFAQIISSEFGP